LSFTIRQTYPLGVVSLQTAHFSECCFSGAGDLPAAIYRNRSLGPTRDWLFACPHGLHCGDPCRGHKAVIGAVLAVLLAVVVSACVFLVAWWLIGKL
jgi:hypothetical protein